MRSVREWKSLCPRQIVVVPNELVTDLDGVLRFCRGSFPDARLSMFALKLNVEKLRPDLTLCDDVVLYMRDSVRDIVKAVVWLIRSWGRFDLAVVIHKTSDKPFSTVTFFELASFLLAHKAIMTYSPSAQTAFELTAADRLRPLWYIAILGLKVGLVGVLTAVTCVLILLGAIVAEPFVLCGRIFRRLCRKSLPSS